MELPVVVHYADGRVLKGTTADFFPKKESFHLVVREGLVAKVSFGLLKAVFFVRCLGGHPGREDEPGFGEGYGRPTTVVFRDGEVMEGRTQAIPTDGAGFFLVPGDPSSNNARVFCVRDALQEVFFT